MEAYTSKELISTSYLNVDQSTDSDYSPIHHSNSTKQSPELPCSARHAGPPEETPTLVINETGSNHPIFAKSGSMDQLGLEVEQSEVDLDSDEYDPGCSGSVTAGSGDVGVGPVASPVVFSPATYLQTLAKEQLNSVIEAVDDGENNDLGSLYPLSRDYNLLVASCSGTNSPAIASTSGYNQHNHNRNNLSPSVHDAEDFKPDVRTIPSGICSSEDEADTEEDVYVDVDDDDLDYKPDVAELRREMEAGENSETTDRAEFDPDALKAISEFSAMAGAGHGVGNPPSSQLTPSTVDFCLRALNLMFPRDRVVLKCDLVQRVLKELGRSTYDHLATFGDVERGLVSATLAKLIDADAAVGVGGASKSADVQDCSGGRSESSTGNVHPRPRRRATRSSANFENRDLASGVGSPRNSVEMMAFKRFIFLPIYFENHYTLLVVDRIFHDALYLDCTLEFRLLPTVRIIANSLGDLAGVADGIRVEPSLSHGIQILPDREKINPEAGSTSGVRMCYFVYRLFMCIVGDVSLSESFGHLFFRIADYNCVREKLHQILIEYNSNIYGNKNSANSNCSASGGAWKIRFREKAKRVKANATRVRRPKYVVSTSPEHDAVVKAQRLKKFGPKKRNGRKPFLTPEEKRRRQNERSKKVKARLMQNEEYRLKEKERKRQSRERQKQNPEALKAYYEKRNERRRAARRAADEKAAQIREKDRLYRQKYMSDPEKRKAISEKHNIRRKERFASNPDALARRRELDKERQRRRRADRATTERLNEQRRIRYQQRKLENPADYEARMERCRQYYHNKLMREGKSVSARECSSKISAESSNSKPRRGRKPRKAKNFMNNWDGYFEDLTDTETVDINQPGDYQRPSSSADYLRAGGETALIDFGTGVPNIVTAQLSPPKLLSLGMCREDLETGCGRSESVPSLATSSQRQHPLMLGLNNINNERGVGPQFPASLLNQLPLAASSAPSFNEQPHLLQYQQQQSQIREQLLLKQSMHQQAVVSQGNLQGISPQLLMQSSLTLPGNTPPAQSGSFQPGSTPTSATLPIVYSTINPTSSTLIHPPASGCILAPSTIPNIELLRQVIGIGQPTVQVSISDPRLPNNDLHLLQTSTSGAVLGGVGSQIDNMDPQTSQVNLYKGNPASAIVTSQILNQGVATAFISTIESTVELNRLKLNRQGPVLSPSICPNSGNSIDGVIQSVALAVAGDKSDRQIGTSDSGLGLPQPGRLPSAESTFGGQHLSHQNNLAGGANLFMPSTTISNFNSQQHIICSSGAAGATTAGYSTARTGSLNTQARNVDFVLLDAVQQNLSLPQGVDQRIGQIGMGVNGAVTSGGDSGGCGVAGSRNFGDGHYANSYLS